AGRRRRGRGRVAGGCHPRRVAAGSFPTPFRPFAPAPEPGFRRPEQSPRPCPGRLIDRGFSERSAHFSPPQELLAILIADCCGGIIFPGGPRRRSSGVLSWAPGCRERPCGWV